MKAPRGEVMVARMLELVRVAAFNPTTRRTLAARWGLTPRNINYLKRRAESWFDCCITHDPHRGYVLTHPGILNVHALRTSRVGGAR